MFLVSVVFPCVCVSVCVHRSKDDNTKDAQNMVILNDIHIDIMDYITPAHCSLLQFRQMWQEFEWENKVHI